MSWRDGRDSCTCSCTLTGLPAQIPTELRRGSANKTQTVILEVPTCLIHTFLQSPRHEERAPAPSTLFIITYILLYYIIHSYIATLYYVACFLPVLGVLGRYLYYIYLYIYMYIYLIMTILLLYTHAYIYVHIYIYIYIYKCDSIIYMVFYINREYRRAHTHAHVRAYISALHIGNM